MTKETAHARFAYGSLEELRQDLERQGLSLPLSEDLSVLASPLEIYHKVIPNRLCVLPMEGCDGTEDGRSRPADLPPVPPVCPGRRRFDLAGSMLGMP